MGAEELSLSDCVKRAVELLPEDDEPMVSTGADEYALFVRRICAEKQSPKQDETVEERHIADVVDQALSRAQYEDDEFAAFQREFGRLSNSSDQYQFRILFPLNMRAGRSESPPETIEANRTIIRKIKSEKWETAVEAAQSADIESTSTVPEILQEDSETVLSTRQHTFYVFEIEAREAALAHSMLQRDLDIILGKLNFTAVDWQLEKDTMDELRSLTRTPPDAISRPPVYLLFKEGEYDTFQETQVTLSSTGFRLPRGFNADFKRIRRFPPAGVGEPCDGELSRGFRALQAGLTAERNESAFLYYWRGIEEITFHDRGDSSKNALERSLPLVHDSFNLTILMSVLESLADKRNDIVHSGIESPVYDRDVILLRQMLYHSLNEMLGLREDNYTKNEIIGVLDYGLHETGSLNQKEFSHKEDYSKLEDSLEELEGARRWRKERASFEDVQRIKQYSD
ncbi:hypothetical protein OB905_14110 [Halobacteria archaeon AArc-dxtr1]|nr:hypothetical protein [Halobacteria archaeon AArc-dxtr1]